MDLSSLIRTRVLIPIADGSLSPTSLSLDSRKVEKGALFVAIPGYQQDGILFVADALQKGAAGIVVSQGMGKKILSRFQEAYPDIVIFEAPEIRKATSLLAAHFYPLQPDTVVAVTGTNGKTSTVSFMRQIWHHMGLPAASLGTLGLVIEGRPLPPPTGTEGINTPNPVMLHQLLQSLKEQHIDHVAFEASSHALHQHRLDSVRLQAAVFTNFSNDHLDYHHTLEAYFDAKARLFKEIMNPPAIAILNTDIEEYAKLLNLCKERDLKTLTFGKKGTLVKLMSLIPTRDGQEIVLQVEDKSYALTLPLVGQFQVYNVMAALSAIIACGGSAPQAVEACLNLKGVPGRLEHAAPGVYVDYSHTPDGLSLALKALRPHTQGKLWVVFGCGGDRDPFKRPVMGDIAATLADTVIVTDDNPRHENPAAIRQQILAKCPNAREIASRHEAIKTALQEMVPEDVVLIAGKGHEPYQLIGDKAFPFNDVEEVQKWVTK
ncbi:MAG: UDP-N-acetylmuramoyl-L-alanyl-D-glutamate--2,6-diaminopimelate ligase [Proteobacteria bacterium]|nr:UDP-N-acetylmuramoyl-L-alanyl-D-glutamate--2,6-diaminopimelate ligase [Pseudomonadota bacterium]